MQIFSIMNYYDTRIKSLELALSPIPAPPNPVYPSIPGVLNI